MLGFIDVDMALSALIVGRRAISNFYGGIGMVKMVRAHLEQKIFFPIPKTIVHHT